MVPSRAQLFGALIAATIIPLAVVAWGSRGQPRSIPLYACMVLYAMVLLNVFLPHLLATVALRAYTPGVLTALALNLPFTAYLFRRALSEGYVTRTGLVVCGGVAILGYVPSVVGAYALGRLGAG